MVSLYGVELVTQNWINYLLCKRNVSEWYLEIVKNFSINSWHCARARPFGNQILGPSFFEKEHTKPLFTKEKILTVHNLYVYHCTLEVYISMHSCLGISKRKPTLLLTCNPSRFFIYKSSKLWNKLCKNVIGDTMDFSSKIATVKTNLKQFLLRNQSKHDENIWCTLNYTHI